MDGVGRCARESILRFPPHKVGSLGGAVARMSEDGMLDEFLDGLGHDGISVSKQDLLQAYQTSCEVRWHLLQGVTSYPPNVTSAFDQILVDPPSGDGEASLTDAQSPLDDDFLFPRERNPAEQGVSLDGVRYLGQMLDPVDATNDLIPLTQLSGDGGAPLADIPGSMDGNFLFPKKCRSPAEWCVGPNDIHSRAEMLDSIAASDNAKLLGLLDPPCNDEDAVRAGTEAPLDGNALFLAGRNLAKPIVSRGGVRAQHARMLDLVAASNDYTLEVPPADGDKAALCGLARATMDGHCLSMSRSDTSSETNGRAAWPRVHDAVEAELGVQPILDCHSNLSDIGCGRGRVVLDCHSTFENMRYRSGCGGHGIGELDAHAIHGGRVGKLDDSAVHDDHVGKPDVIRLVLDERTISELGENVVLDNGGGELDVHAIRDGRVGELDNGAARDDHGGKPDVIHFVPDDRAIGELDECVVSDKVVHQAIRNDHGVDTSNPPGELNLIGDWLYVLVEPRELGCPPGFVSSHGDLAGILVGMLLEGLSRSELISLLGDSRLRTARLAEALGVLREARDPRAPPSYDGVITEIVAMSTATSAVSCNDVDGIATDQVDASKTATAGTSGEGAAPNVANVLGDPGRVILQSSNRRDGVYTHQNQKAERDAANCKGVDGITGEVSASSATTAVADIGIAETNVPNNTKAGADGSGSAPNVTNKLGGLGHVARHAGDRRIDHSGGCGWHDGGSARRSQDAAMTEHGHGVLRGDCGLTTVACRSGVILSARGAMATTASRSSEIALDTPAGNAVVTTGGDLVVPKAYNDPSPGADAHGGPRLVLDVAHGDGTLRNTLDRDSDVLGADGAVLRPDVGTNGGRSSGTPTPRNGTPVLNSATGLAGELFDVAVLDSARGIGGALDKGGTPADVTDTVGDRVVALGDGFESTHASGAEANGTMPADASEGYSDGPADIVIGEGRRSVISVVRLVRNGRCGVDDLKTDGLAERATIHDPTSGTRPVADPYRVGRVLDNPGMINDANTRRHADEMQTLTPDRPVMTLLLPACTGRQEGMDGVIDLDCENDDLEDHDGLDHTRGSVGRRSGEAVVDPLGDNDHAAQAAIVVRALTNVIDLGVRANAEVQRRAHPGQGNHYDAGHCVNDARLMCALKDANEGVGYARGGATEKGIACDEGVTLVAPLYSDSTSVVVTLVGGTKPGDHAALVSGGKCDGLAERITRERVVIGLGYGTRGDAAQTAVVLNDLGRGGALTSSRALAVGSLGNAGPLARANPNNAYMERRCVRGEGAVRDGGCDSLNDGRDDASHIDHRGSKLDQAALGNVLGGTVDGVHTDGELGDHAALGIHYEYGDRTDAGAVPNDHGDGPNSACDVVVLDNRATATGVNLTRSTVGVINASMAFTANACDEGVVSHALAHCDGGEALTCVLFPEQSALDSCAVLSVRSNELDGRATPDNHSGGELDDRVALDDGRGARSDDGTLAADAKGKDVTLGDSFNVAPTSVSITGEGRTVPVGVGPARGTRVDAGASATDATGKEVSLDTPGLHSGSGMCVHSAKVRFSIHADGLSMQTRTTIDHTDAHGLLTCNSSPLATRRRSAWMLNVIACDDVSTPVMEPPRTFRARLPSKVRLAGACSVLAAPKAPTLRAYRTCTRPLRGRAHSMMQIRYSCAYSKLCAMT